MKIILKTIKPANNIDYNETFSSERNINIRRKLIPELRKAMLPHYKPSVGQLTKWLRSLHKSRRSQSKLKETGKITEDSHRVHRNNRTQDVKFKISKYFTLLY